MDMAYSALVPTFTLFTTFNAVMKLRFNLTGTIPWVHVFKSKLTFYISVIEVMPLNLKFTYSVTQWSCYAVVVAVTERVSNWIWKITFLIFYCLFVTFLNMFVLYTYY